MVQGMYARLQELKVRLLEVGLTELLRRSQQISRKCFRIWTLLLVQHMIKVQSVRSNGFECTLGRTFFPNLSRVAVHYCCLDC